MERIRLYAGYRLAINAIRDGNGLVGANVIYNGNGRRSVRHIPPYIAGSRWFVHCSVDLRVKYFTLSFEYDVVSLFGELKVIFCKELQFLNAELDMFVIEGGKKTSFKDEQL